MSNLISGPRLNNIHGDSTLPKDSWSVSHHSCLVLLVLDKPLMTPLGVSFRAWLPPWPSPRRPILHLPGVIYQPWVNHGSSLTWNMLKHVETCLHHSEIFWINKICMASVVKTALKVDQVGPSWTKLDRWKFGLDHGHHEDSVVEVLLLLWAPSPTKSWNFGMIGMIEIRTIQANMTDI